MRIPLSEYGDLEDFDIEILELSNVTFSTLLEHH